LLKQRVITAVLGLPIVIAAFWFGEPWFAILMSVAVALGAREFYGMARSGGLRPLELPGIGFAVLSLLVPFLWKDALYPLLSALVVLPLVWLLFRKPREGAFLSWAWTAAGVIYTGWLASYWVGLREATNGQYLALWAIIVCFASDTGAYFVGRAFGRHKMAPNISPKKTWEGAAGGLLTTILGSWLFGTLVFNLMDWPAALLLGVPMSLAAQLGDLVGSLLKRNFKCKDAGAILPGHGGLLDRLGSLVFTGVTAYYLLVAIGKLAA
jgi:phosphatidate cytidylyltransferase